MARTPDGITARSVTLSARFRPSTIASLDRLRKDMPRTRFIEKLISEQERREKDS